MVLAVSRRYGARLRAAAVPLVGAVVFVPRYKPSIIAR
jgi:hypothetical protein